jgi:hypothetical protein
MAARHQNKFPYRRPRNSLKNLPGRSRKFQIPRDYDRIISIATFEHLEDLPKVVCRAASLLAKEGVLQMAVPSEGFLLWKLASNLSTGVAFRLTTGLSYSVFMRFEHISLRERIGAMFAYSTVALTSVHLKSSPTTTQANTEVAPYTRRLAPRRKEDTVISRT